MMTNLFNIFDPQLALMNILNWMSLVLLMIIIPSNLWIMTSKLSVYYTKMLSLLSNEIKSVLKTMASKPNSVMISALFMLLAMNNLISLLPYVFNTTSHMSMTLSLSFPLWLSAVAFGAHNFYLTTLAHLVPQGTPGPLMPFMVIIELISTLIRPITLSIRMAANMVAGHLLISLVGSQAMAASILQLSFVLLIQLLLLILELAVSVIQSYVLVILVTLYISEI